jgi:hypothetical protein
MRVSRKEKGFVALAAALVLTVAQAAPASADTGELDASGSLTIQTFPPQVVPIGGSPRPCENPLDRFAVTTDGGATSGTVDIDWPPLYFPKPGSSPAVDDVIRIDSVFDDLEYERIGTSYDYDISGTTVLILDIWNLEHWIFFCHKTDFKCTFVLQLDVTGSSMSNGQALPTIGALATVDLVATTTIPLTYSSGDNCDEYLTLDGAGVDVDLDLTRV